MTEPPHAAATWTRLQRTVIYITAAGLAVLAVRWLYVFGFSGYRASMRLYMIPISLGMLVLAAGLFRQSFAAISLVFSLIVLALGSASLFLLALAAVYLPLFAAMAVVSGCCFWIIRGLFRTKRQKPGWHRKAGLTFRERCGNVLRNLKPGWIYRTTFMAFAATFVPVFLNFGLAFFMVPSLYVATVAARTLWRPKFGQTWIALGHLTIYLLAFHAGARVTYWLSAQSRFPVLRLAIKMTALTAVFFCSFSRVITYSSIQGQGGTYTFWSAVARYFER